MGASVTTDEPKSKQGKAELSAGHAAPAPSSLEPESTYGATAGMPLFLGISLQRKLDVGAVDDPLEREADQIAEQVMRMPEPAAQKSPTMWDAPSRPEDGHPTLSGLHATIQRKCACGGQPAGQCEECEQREEVPSSTPAIQRRASSNGNGDSGGTEAPLIVHNVLRSPGKPLDDSVRPQMESRFGRDFSDVRVHTDSAAARSAEAVNAVAYTAGKAVVFAKGRFSPDTREGEHLLAHELTHVVQQSAAAPVLQREPKDPPAPPAPPPEPALEEAEAWYQEMNIDEAFSDPSGPYADAPTDEEWASATEEWLQQSLTPEEMHRQLLVRRAQRLGASAYQAADPVAARARMDHWIAGIEADIKARKENITKLGRRQPARAQVRAERAQIKALEKDLRSVTKARTRLSRATRFSTMGEGGAAGTGRITYAGIQVETAGGERIALEFAETTTAEHAEEVIIKQFRSQLTAEQLRGAKITVVGDQVVCSGRCVPALRDFAVQNDVESVDGIVFQRREILPAGFIGPPDLASPRTTLRGMTKPSAEGMELYRTDLAIYRRSGASAAGAGGAVVADAAAAGTRVTAQEAPGLFSRLGESLVKQIKSITPAKAAKFGVGLLTEAVKGLFTAVAVDYIIGDSRLEEDLAALDEANHVPHDSTPERIRSVVKFGLSLLPPELAIPLAGTVRTINPISPEFLYEATVQENKRKWEKFKEEHGDSDDAYLLFVQGEKAADDWANGITPWDQ